MGAAGVYIRQRCLRVVDDGLRNCWDHKDGKIKTLQL